MTIPRHLERRKPPEGDSYIVIGWLLLAFAAGVAAALYWGR